MAIGYTSLQHPCQYLLGDPPIAESYTPKQPRAPILDGLFVDVVLGVTGNSSNDA